MKVRHLKRRMFARMGKLTPVFHAPKTFDVKRLKDDVLVASGVTQEVADEMIAKAKKAKRAGLYALAA